MANSDGHPELFSVPVAGSRRISCVFVPKLILNFRMQESSFNKPFGVLAQAGPLPIECHVSAQRGHVGCFERTMLWPCFARP
jgi:hypothetical protein